MSRYIGTCARSRRRACRHAGLAMRTLLLTLVLSLSLAASAAAMPADRVLSNETTLSRWAHTNDAAKVRLKPSNKSRVVGKLRYFTEDNLPEVYLVLRSHTDSRKREWVQVRLPKRPNGTKGWVPREAVGPFRVVRTQLVIDQRRLRATLYRSGKRIFQAPVGVGKAGTPTPKGRFWIREKLKGFGNAYGPLAFGTSAYSPGLTDWPGGGVIGIHGTNQPALVPGRPSHGCVRMKNKSILRLARLMPIGTPVHIK